MDVDGGGISTGAFLGVIGGGDDRRLLVVDCDRARIIAGPGSASDSTGSSACRVCIARETRRNQEEEERGPRGERLNCLRALPHQYANVPPRRPIGRNLRCNPYSVLLF